MIVFAWHTSVSQDRVNEVGLTFRDFESFGVSYKTGRPEALWRFNSLFINAGKSQTTSSADDETIQNSLGIGFSVGREYRKQIIDNLQLRYGADVSFSYSAGKTTIKVIGEEPNQDRTLKNRSYGPGLAAVLGLNYVIKEKIVIGAEILPGLSYNVTKSKIDYESLDYADGNAKTHGVNFYASFSRAMLTLAYRLQK